MSVLQNRATTDFLLLKQNLRCQQFPGMYYFNVPYFFHTIDNQINNLCREIKSPRNRLISPPKMILFLHESLDSFLIKYSIWDLCFSMCYYPYHPPKIQCQNPVHTSNHACSLVKDLEGLCKPRGDCETRAGPTLLSSLHTLQEA